MRPRFRLTAAIAALAIGAGLANGTLAATAAPAPPTPAPPAVTLPGDVPPYEAQLMRLAEILGALHYLRPLCKADDGGTWREQMQALIDSEQPSEERRQRMVDRFNRGYESFRSVYRECTAAATLAAERYLDEGTRITADITARYGK